jgi:hypothetical protein
MDQLDLWFDRQVGWRRSVLTWLQMSPAAVMLGCSAWAFLTPGAAGPGLSFLEVTACSLLAAIPLACVFAMVQCRRAALHGNRPVFSWCMYAGTLCIMTVVLLNLLTNQQPYWPHIHRVIGLVSVPLALAGAGFCLEAARRAWRLSKDAVPRSLG